MAVVAVLLCGCTDDGVVLVPIIDTPGESSRAYPYEGLDTFELSVSRAGEQAPLALTVAAVGDELELADVPFGDQLVVHLSGGASEVEIAYGRTCPLEVVPGRSVVETRLYFARIVRWGTTEEAVPVVPTRTGGHGYSLADGTVVLAGGDSEVIERFDPPGSGAFAALPARMLARRDQLLLPFENGSAIVVGGVDGTGDAVARVELLDPTAEAVGRQLEEFAGPALVGHAGALLVDGSIIVAGGREQGGPGEPFAVTDRAWRFMLGPGGALESIEALGQRMQLARSEHTMTRLGGEVGADVLIVGGRDGDGQGVADAELYRPLRETFELLGGATLDRPRWNHAAVRMPGGFVLVIGGMSNQPADDTPVPELELYDPVQGVFTAAGTLPANAGITELSVTLLPDGRALLAGGRDSAGRPVTTVLVARLDPLTGQVDLSPSDSLSIPRAGHSAVSLCDGSILLTGGTDDPTGPAERYSPPSAGRR